VSWNTLDIIRVRIMKRYKEKNGDVYAETTNNGYR
jgi:hypothetical protein